MNVPPSNAANSIESCPDGTWRTFTVSQYLVLFCTKKPELNKVYRGVWLTVATQHQRCGRSLHPRLCDGVGHHAGVVPHVRRLHLGDVQVPRLLGHEHPVVLLHERGVLVEDPGEH